MRMRPVIDQSVVVQLERERCLLAYVVRLAFSARAIHIIALK